MEHYKQRFHKTPAELFKTRRGFLSFSYSPVLGAPPFRGLSP